MKKIVFSLTMLFPTFAVAAPNVWTVGGNQGLYEHSISDAQGNRLFVQCDDGYTDDEDLEERRHEVSLYLKNNRKVEEVVVVINGKSYTPLSIPLFLDDGRAEWQKFNRALGKATKIEVYNSNKTKKLATFNPTKASSKSVGGCRV